MSDKPELDIVPPGHVDVVATLRRIADEIEAGEHGLVVAAVLAVETSADHGGVQAFGMGRGDGIRLAGLMGLAQHSLYRMALDECDTERSA